MKRSLQFGFVILLSIFAPLLDCLAIGGGDTEVFVAAKYKTGFVFAPDPDFPQSAERRGMHGQGVYNLAINPKDGSVDEVKVLHHAGRDLDASAVFTLFKWKAKPGAGRRQDVLVDFRLTRYLRQTR